MMKSPGSSYKILIIIIALLLIANLGTLAILFGSKKTAADEHKSAMRDYLKTEIRFDSSQLAAFDTIRTVHHAEVNKIYDSMREHKRLGIQALAAAGFSDSMLHRQARSAAADQEYLEMTMLSHLRQIRNLCTPSQRVTFDTGVYRIITRNLGNRSAK